MIPLRRILVLVALGATLVPSSLPAAGPPPDAATYSGHGFAPVHGARLFYEVKGRGEPLVLIHGGQMDCRMWDQQFESYSRYFRVLRYDIRGFGGSVMPETPFSNADDLAGLMEYLGMTRAHIVGLSLGGMVATDLAVTHPECVRSLVLSGPGLTGFDPEGPEEVARYYAEVRTARDQPADSLVRAWLDDPLIAPAAGNPKLRARLERMTRENVGAWLGNWRLQRVPRPPTAARLADIVAPTLILVGDRDLPSIVATVDTLAKAVRGARKAVIPGAGHMLPMEKPAEFDRAVMEFLRGLGRPGN
jgi:pimeloyl-ACP methyl ester carboxylesterase